MQATLYFPPAKQQPAAVSPKKTLSKKADTVKIEERKIPVPEAKQVKEVAATHLVENEQVREEAKPETTLPLKKQASNKKVLTSKSSTKSITQNSLDKLRNRLNNQALELSQNDSLNQYLTDKNTIERSTTKLYEIPQAKAKKVEVDCNASALNTAIMALSGLTGGSVRCNSMPDLKEFLKKREEEKMQLKRRKR